MKIGIISINKYSKHLNYGAGLHTYAFQQYLDKFHLDNTIIDYTPRFMKHYNMHYPFLTPPPKKRVARVFFWLINFFHNDIKYKKFMDFFDRHYRSTKCHYDEEALENAILKFDTIICESDVIWSPHTTEGFERAYFCDLPSMNGMNHISYAASIGYTKFSPDRQVQFRELLKNMDYISVREQQGAEFTREFTEKPVANVLDPTLLLDAEDYEDICIAPKERNYVLVYNCLKNNKKMIEDAKKIAKEKNLKVIELSVYIQNKLDHKTVVAKGIEEFIGYFKYADFVVTNAFHGVCFSLVFKKDFYTYARGTKDSRVTSILGILDIPQRFLLNDEELPKVTSIDYQKVYEKLEKERLSSQEFLFHALGIEENGIIS